MAYRLQLILSVTQRATAAAVAARFAIPLPAASAGVWPTDDESGDQLLPIARECFHLDLFQYQ